MTNSDNNMHDIKQEEWTKAVLICVDLGEYDPDQSLLELEELAKTAQAEVQAKVIQRRETYDKATCIGSGRLEEITAFCKENETELLIFDNELTATQTRNIEEITQIRVIDRTTLILDIFAMRARSKEGRLQVELAPLLYMVCLAANSDQCPRCFCSRFNFRCSKRASASSARRWFLA